MLDSGGDDEEGNGDSGEALLNMASATLRTPLHVSIKYEGRLSWTCCLEKVQLTVAEWIHESGACGMRPRLSIQSA